MSSIRTKITLFTICEVIIAVVMVTLLAVFSINGFGKNTSNLILELLCETGTRNLNAYFASVEQAAKTVSAYATSDLAHTDLSNLGAHLDRVDELFQDTARNTSSIRTFYYRIDPKVSADEGGFWYVYSGRDGFVPHTVTDISQYDTENQNELVWFTVAKAKGEPVWLSPYITDNLEAYVLSYNIPIYKEDTFVGVIGIEIDYTTMAEVVDSITLYDNGYAFINDAEGSIIYHPRIDVPNLRDSEMPKPPAGLMSDSSYLRYTYEGIEKQGVWLPLNNGMRLNVTVPIAEINTDWQALINRIAVVSVALLIVFALLTRHFMRRVTDPLSELTEVAEQLNVGNYDVELSYEGNDEVGTLTQTVDRLVRHLKVYIEELNSLAYADALTHVHNKGAFAISVRDLEVLVEDTDNPPAFAIGMFDCDCLKQINDEFGHDKGDVYIQTACSIICNAFDHSPVFRVGGDEFAVILQGSDYEEREAIFQQFEERCSAQIESAKERWEQVSISAGIAVYDPASDESVQSVIQRADELMYEDKRRKKAAR